MKTTLVCTIAMALLTAALSLTAAEDPPATQPADPEVTADEVIRELMERRETRQAVTAEVEPATAPATQPDTVAPAEIVKPLPMPPGAMIVGRLGRLRRDESSSYWQFHFESERDVLYEPPMRVLPNRLLEAMETILETSGRTTVRFKVSGEITTYRGDRYLLIRRMLVYRDTGAL
ncbi:MAG: hypothetical protein ACOC95_08130 [Planctomycetota bacterium]